MQFVPVIDATVLIAVAVAVIAFITAGLILKKVSRARAAEERARMQRLMYQPSVKPVPITPPAPVPRPVRKPQVVTGPGPDPVLENCRNLPASIRALTEKYSLDSFTVATSDGLVLATSGSSTAQEDAALYSGKYNGHQPQEITLFGLNHKGSDLVGIIRSQETVTEETKRCIERDIQGILTRWV